MPYILRRYNSIVFHDVLEWNKLSYPSHYPVLIIDRVVWAIQSNFGRFLETRIRLFAPFATPEVILPYDRQLRAR